MQTSMAQQHRITFNPTFKPFYHGISSGDPMEDKVILWTRYTPDSGNVTSKLVYWQMATDPAFSNVVNYGKAYANESEDFTVKVDVCGLQPNTFYYYLFSDGVKNSIVGRTKTAPGANSDNDSARFAVVSCASWEHGYFNAYENISTRNDIDAVLHLGDYIYEYATGDFSDNIAGRTYDPPAEAVTKEQYQLRYSQYKLDDQLRRIHQLFPFITVWDDHETCNDAWREGGENHTPATEGPYLVRKSNSTATYFKWMPIRKPDLFDTIRIFRKLRYGKLLDLIMLDTRLYDRDEQDGAATNDPNRHMMGPVERAWYFQQLQDTTTTWKIIGNQVMFAPMKAFGQILNADQWDGYDFERNLITNQVINNNVKNLVILTGDIHTSWVNDVPGPSYNGTTGAGSIGVEFVGPSITSYNFPIPVGQNIIKSFNPHMKYVNLDDHGFYYLDVRKTRTQADYKFNTVTSLGANQSNGPSYKVDVNAQSISLGAAVAPAPFTVPIPSLMPNHSLPVTKISNLVYVATDNKTAIYQPLFPTATICPSLQNSIIDQANNGVSSIQNGTTLFYKSSNLYQGQDTVIVQYCQTAEPFECDTIIIVLTVSNKTITDTINVAVLSGHTYTGCVRFDDIAQANTITHNSPANIALQFASDSCFTFTADSNFAGVNYLQFVGCDGLGNCDTVVYKISIKKVAKASTEYITVSKNTIVNRCFKFDDLLGTKGANQLIVAPKNGNFSFQSDSCFKYAPFYNFVGADTFIISSCDNSTPPVCDTIIYIVNFTTVGIETQEAVAVLGVYPVPAEDYVAIQYFAYVKTPISFELFDIQGKKIISKTETPTLNDVHQAVLNTSNLAKGNYTLKIKQGANVYTKKITKE
jgi:alkaline phosphatase D